MNCKFSKLRFNVFADKSHLPDLAVNCGVVLVCVVL